MALKYLLEVTLLVSTIVLALADNECFQNDVSIRSCDTCCGNDCCPSSSGVAIGAGVGGGLLFLAIVVVCVICIMRRRLASRGVVVHQPSSALILSSTIPTSRVTLGIATPGVNERPMYNQNVPQTGTYAYEQPTTFAASPSGYIPRKETLAASTPYSPQY